MLRDWGGMGWHEKNQLFSMCPGRGLRPELSVFTTTGAFYS